MGFEQRMNIIIFVLWKDHSDGVEDALREKFKGREVGVGSPHSKLNQRQWEREEAELIEFSEWLDMVGEGCVRARSGLIFESGPATCGYYGNRK